MWRLHALVAATGAAVWHITAAHLELDDLLLEVPKHVAAEAQVVLKDVDAALQPYKKARDTGAASAPGTRSSSC
jgi:hypothetical protein